MYKRQVNILRTKGGVFQQPTKGDLAVYAAREMQRYIVSVVCSGNLLVSPLDKRYGSFQGSAQELKQKFPI